jgi:hypothetical protein
LIVGLLIGAIATYAIAGPSPSRTTTVTSISTTTVTTDSTQQVMSAYAAHLKNIESENVDAIVSGYANNATFGIIGQASGFVGTETGVFNIRLLYSSILSQDLFATVNIKNMSYVVYVLGNGEAKVNSTFTMYGNSAYMSARHGATPLVMGTYVANASSAVSYVQVDNNWLVSNETWNVTSLDFTG